MKRADGREYVATIKATANRTNKVHRVTFLLVIDGLPARQFEKQAVTYDELAIIEVVFQETGWNELMLEPITDAELEWLIAKRWEEKQ